MDNVTFKEEDAITLHGQILEAAIRKTGPPSWPKALVVGIGSEPKALTERITSRTDRMIEMGLVGEVASLAQKYPWPMPLRYTIGYRELRPYVEDSTNNSLDDAIDMINDDTMRYARRQRAWFARRPEIRWTDSPEEAAEIAIQHLHDQGL